MAKVDLTRFRRALKGNPDATEALPDRTWRRYITGEFPKNLLWFLKNPAILRALLEDAERWTAEDFALIESLADKRASAQGRWRDQQKEDATKPPAKPKGKPKK